VAFDGRALAPAGRLTLGAAAARLNPVQKCMAARLATVATAALAIAVPATASAGEVPQTNLGSANGLNYRQAGPVVLGPGAETFTFAECGQGHAVTGGGLFAQAVAQMRTTFTAPFDLPPSGRPKDAWAAGAHNLSIFERSLTVYAICRRAGPRGLAYRSDGVTIQPGEAGRLTLACPGDSAVLGGGAGGAGSDTWVNTSRPYDDGDPNSKPDDGWKVRGYNDSGLAVDFDGHAVCTDRGTRELRYRRNRLDDVGAGSGAGATARCRSTEAVTGGGISISGPASQAWIAFTHPTDDKGDPGSTPEDGWDLTAFNSTGVDKDMTVYAICKG
jgi:hypothetical protein